MRPERLALFLVPIAVGVGLGLALPRGQTITIAFARGGRTFTIQDDPPVTIPGTLRLDDNGRLRLRVINRDSVAHQAGVLAVPAHDSTEVGADVCTGEGHGGAATIVLR